MIKTKNFKELKDGRYKLVLPDDVRSIFIGRCAQYLRDMFVTSYEYFLTAELIEALKKEQIKLRRSEFFLLFSPRMQRPIEESTKTYIYAFLEFDEIKRQMQNQSQLSAAKEFLFS